MERAPGSPDFPTCHGLRTVLEWAKSVNCSSEKRWIFLLNRIVVFLSEKEKDYKWNDALKSYPINKTSNHAKQVTKKRPSSLQHI